ncbi:MAG: hypothetical protein IPJ94_17535 [Chloroflexi bacterium]|nr:hypothetical protein [Chloroflexota bacterium]
MLTHKKLIFGLFSVLLAAALFLSMRPQKCADGICAKQLPDAPTYGVPGAYPVGSRLLAMEEGPRLALTIWYPAAAGGEKRPYPIPTKSSCHFLGR